jgi:hypothetical protein
VLRKLMKFSRQHGRWIAALVRPVLWLAVFAAGFLKVFGVAIVEPYDTYVPYDVYIAPGLIGMVLLFNGMQGSLGMVYDREMGTRKRWSGCASRCTARCGRGAVGSVGSLVTCFVLARFGYQPARRVQARA